MYSGDGRMQKCFWHISASSFDIIEVTVVATGGWQPAHYWRTTHHSQSKVNLIQFYFFGCLFAYLMWFSFGKSWAFSLSWEFNHERNERKLNFHQKCQISFSPHQRPSPQQVVIGISVENELQQQQPFLFPYLSLLVASINILLWLLNKRQFFSLLKGAGVEMISWRKIHATRITRCYTQFSAVFRFAPVFLILLRENDDFHWFPSCLKMPLCF